MKDFRAIYSNFFMDFRKPTTLEFRLDFNYRVVRLITCLLTLWGGTTVWWFSMKMSLENDFWILSYLGQTVSCHTLKKDFRFDDRRIVAKTKWFFVKSQFLLQYLICDCENCLWSFYFPFIDNRVRTGVLLFSACTCSFAYDLY